MRCLVVPSDGYLTAQVARALTGRGCEVASAPSETEAAAALDSADVVVVDLLRAGALADGIVDVHKADPDALVGKTIVGLTSILTWGKTAAKSQPIAAANEHARAPVAGYLPLLELERRLLRCRGAYVVCPGVMYGMGEDASGLGPLLDGAFNANKVALYGSGTNVLPTCHVSDAADYVARLAEAKPAAPYHLVLDGAGSTLGAISEAVATAFGATITPLGLTDLLALDAVPDHLLLNLDAQPSVLEDASEGAPAGASAGVGVPGRIDAICEEYRASYSVEPKRFLFLGPPCAGKAHLAEIVAREFGLELIDGANLRKLEATFIEEAEKKAAAALAAQGEKEGEKTKDKDKDAGAGVVPKPSFDALLDKPNFHNKGYVLVGCPDALEHAMSLFPSKIFAEEAEDGEAADAAAGEGVAGADAGPGAGPDGAAGTDPPPPNIVVCLRAEDAALQERASGKGLDDKEFASKLGAFKKANEDDKKEVQERAKRIQDAAEATSPAPPSGEEGAPPSGRDAAFAEAVQVSGVGAYFAFLGSTVVDLENTWAPPAAEAAAGEGETPAEGPSLLEDLMRKLSLLPEAAPKKEEGEAKPNADAPEYVGEEGKDAEGGPTDAKAAEGKGDAGALPSAKLVALASAGEEAGGAVQDAAFLVGPVQDLLMKDVMPLVTKGLVAIAETKPERPLKALGQFLIDRASE